MAQEPSFEILPPASVASAAREETPPMTPAEFAILKRVENLARFLDSAVNIPGINKRIGADGVIGLVLPVVGDALAAIASCYIVGQARKLGLPPFKITTMITNVVVDTGVGAIPLAGDLFDLAVKANLKNADLIRAHFNLPPMPRAWKNERGEAA